MGAFPHHRVFNITKVILVIATFEVVARYVFNHPTSWAWEVNEHLLCVFLSMAAGYTLLLGRHVSVDLLYVRFSVRVRAIIDLVTWLLFFLVCAVVVWEGASEAWESTLKQERVLSSFNSPLYPAKWMIPIGASLLLLQGIVKYTRDLMTALHGDRAVK
ncbi:hypothetical protein ES703_100623 [subsurface metagenome]